MSKTPTLNEVERLVLQTIHDFQFDPYPSLETVEVKSEVITCTPRTIAQVPDYLIHGAVWPADPTASLRALQTLKLIDQPRGRYDANVHCRLPDGRELRPITNYFQTNTRYPGDSWTRRRMALRTVFFPRAEPRTRRGRMRFQPDIKLM